MDIQTIKDIEAAYNARQAAAEEAEFLEHIEAVRDAPQDGSLRLICLLDVYLNPVDMSDPEDVLEWSWEIASHIPWGKA